MSTSPMLDVWQFQLLLNISDRFSNYRYCCLGEHREGWFVYDNIKQNTGIFFLQLIQKLTDVAEECQNNQLKKLKEICEK